MQENQNQQVGETTEDKPEVVEEYKPNRHERRKRAAIERRERRQKLKERENKQK